METYDEYNHVRNKIAAWAWTGGKRINGKWTWPESNVAIDRDFVQDSGGDCLKGYYRTLKSVDCNSAGGIILCERVKLKPFVTTTTTPKLVPVHVARLVKNYLSTTKKNCRVLMDFNSKVIMGYLPNFLTS
jgi:hypothetical protein